MSRFLPGLSYGLAQPSISQQRFISRFKDRDWAPRSGPERVEYILRWALDEESKGNHKTAAALLSAAIRAEEQVGS